MHCEKNNQLSASATGANNIPAPLNDNGIVHDQMHRCLHLNLFSLNMIFAFVSSPMNSK